MAMLQFLYMHTCSMIVQNRIQQERIEDKKDEVSQASHSGERYLWITCIRVKKQKKVNCTTWLGLNNCCFRKNIVLIVQ
jgi:hypothetical protein